MTNPTIQGPEAHRDEPRTGAATWWNDQSEPDRDGGLWSASQVRPTAGRLHRSASNRSAVLLVGVLAGVALLALATLKLLPFGGRTAGNPGQPLASAAAAVPAPTAAAPTAGSPAAPSATPANPAAVIRTASARDYAPIPANVASLKGYDFGFLHGVKQADGRITLAFDRASFYSGEEAVRRNHGKAPDDDYIIENTNRRVREFRLDPEAPVFGSIELLGGGSDRVPLSQPDFVRRARSALSLLHGGWGIPIWLRHTKGLDGDVTALAEQFLP